jgi:preprotein translocase subunit SecB
MTNETPDQSNEQNPNLPLNIHAQYIKDMSFENPNAPSSLRNKGEGAPQMEVNFNLDSSPMEEKGRFEVTLSAHVRATRNNATLFIAELVYGVVCSVAPNVPDQHIHPLIMIEVPKMAFPFVRQILCEAVMNGGYPPMMLNPVDFEGLYIAQYKKEQGQNNGGGEDAN